MLNCKEVGRKPPNFGDASIVATELLNSGYEFDQGSVIFNRFRYDACSALFFFFFLYPEFLRVNLSFLCCRSVISYKTDQKPLFSIETVANAGSVCFPKRSFSDPQASQPEIY